MAYYWTAQQKNAALVVGASTSVVFRTNLVAPQITSSTPPGATTGTAYSFTVTTTGDPAPQVTVTDGALPAGLSVDSATGVISGTPTHSGTFAFTIAASNRVQPDATASYTMIVNAAPVITSGVPPKGMVGAAYSFTLTATGSPAPTFSVTTGTLPDGLSLDGATGIISGTPTAAEAAPFTVSADNGIALGATADYTLQVDAALASTVTGETPPVRLAVTGSDTAGYLGFLGIALTLLGLSILLVRRRGTGDRSPCAARMTAAASAGPQATAASD